MKDDYLVIISKTLNQFKETSGIQFKLTYIYISIRFCLFIGTGTCVCLNVLHCDTTLQLLSKMTRGRSWLVLKSNQTKTKKNNEIEQVQ